MSFYHFTINITRIFFIPPNTQLKHHNSLLTAHPNKQYIMQHSAQLQLGARRKNYSIIPLRTLARIVLLSSINTNGIGCGYYSDGWPQLPADVFYTYTTTMRIHVERFSILYSVGVNGMSPARPKNALGMRERKKKIYRVPRRWQ